MEFTGHGVFGEHDRLKRSVVKSRAPVVSGDVLTFWWSKGSLM